MSSEKVEKEQKRYEDESISALRYGKIRATFISYIFYVLHGIINIDGVYYIDTCQGGISILLVILIFFNNY